MGIDRQRIVDDFMPARLRGRLALHAVRHPERLRRRRVVRVRPGRGQGDAGSSRLPGRLRDQDPVPRRRPRLRCRTRTSSPTALQAAAQGQPEHRRDDRGPGVRHVHRQRRRRQARRHPPPRLGRRLSRTQTNFLDYHFGAGASKQFGDKFATSPRPWTKARSASDDAARAPAYDDRQQRHQARTSRWSRSPTAARPSAYRADVSGRAHLAARQRDLRGHDARATAPSSSGCRTPSRPACTAPTRPTARPCASASR